MIGEATLPIAGDGLDGRADTSPTAVAAITAVQYLA